MIGDIVQELRDAAVPRTAGILPSRKLYMDAADEIEQLRQDVEDLKHDIERYMNIANAEVNK